MPQRRVGTKVWGPYPDRGGYRVVLAQGGKRTSFWFSTQEEAEKRIVELEEGLKLEGPISVSEALDEYEAWKRDRGLKPGSIKTLEYRLRSILTQIDVPLGSIDDGKAQALYDALRTRTYGKAKKLIAGDTHQSTLKGVRAFWQWCIEKKGWIKANPWEAVDPVGRRRRGKAQLRIDEARRFQAKCLELADQGDEGAVASLMCLLLGLRASEVVERVWRDLDDDSSLLWVDGTKTEAARRRVDVPEVLRGAFTRLAKGANLEVGTPRVGCFFPGRSRHWLRYEVRRLCRLAGVPTVCPHGLRGTHASLAMAAGASSVLVAASLGHASPSVTLQHYAQETAVMTGRTKSVTQALAGDRTGSEAEDETGT